MSGDKQKKHVAVIGGGLVGALNACYMAKRGYKVELFEKRGDIRKMEIVKGRSINLALSVRGREALKGVGLEDLVTSKGIPMYARMIHDLDGTMHPIPYGKKHQFIMSVDRRKLNEVLLTAAEKYPDVSFHFDHKLQSCDFKTGSMEFEKKDGSPAKFEVDLVIGNDGAFSAVRRQMMKDSLMNYQQEYIPHGYMELTIPPDSNGEFAMPANYLHIWPRNEYMMIALPNQDKSFTLTLFMPFEMFDTIKTEEDVMRFFKEQFPDSIPLIGITELKDTFMKSKALPMVSIKCSPYHIGGKGVIMGDAAHAMVPFYGQGMNAGFEDCIVFSDTLNEYGDNFDEALKAYTQFRTPDAQAINDLAMYNYIEMRKSVNSKLFLLRKKLDNLLYVLFPNSWIPLYTMVAFTRTRYHQCIQKRNWQDKVLTRFMYIGAAAVATGSLLVLRHTYQEDMISKLHDQVTMLTVPFTKMFN